MHTPLCKPQLSDTCVAAVCQHLHNLTSNNAVRKFASFCHFTKRCKNFYSPAIPIILTADACTQKFTTYPAVLVNDLSNKRSWIAAADNPVHHIHQIIIQWNMLPLHARQHIAEPVVLTGLMCGLLQISGSNAAACQVTLNIIHPYQPPASKTCWPVICC